MARLPTNERLIAQTGPKSMPAIKNTGVSSFKVGIRAMAGKMKHQIIKIRVSVLRLPFLSAIFPKMMAPIEASTKIAAVNRAFVVSVAA